MRTRLLRAFMAVTVLFFARHAAAQSDAGITAGALVSIQPVDNWFGGPPYLDEGIGGWAPGVTVGGSVIRGNGFTILADVSTTRPFTQLQHGRFIQTRLDQFHSGTSNTHLRDTIVDLLSGKTFGSGASRFALTGGIAFVKTTVTEDDTPLDDLAGDFNTHRFVALAGGGDYYRTLGGNVALLIGGRYFLVDRSSAAEDLGIGRHIVRVVAGLRIRMN